MPRGRKPIPDHVKIMRGTQRKDRMNPDAPTPSSDMPRPPDLLSRRACEYFGELRTRLDNEGRASSSHTSIIAAAAVRLDELETCNKTIEEEGMFYKTVTETGSTITRTHTAVTHRNEILRHLQSLLAELGLTPVSMGKVIKPGGVKKPSNRFANLA